MNLDGSMVNATYRNIHADHFDIDTVKNMLYYYDRDDRNITRSHINQTATETIYQYTDHRLRWNLAVDRIGRYIHFILCLKCIYIFYTRIYTCKTYRECCDLHLQNVSRVLEF